MRIFVCPHCASRRIQEIQRVLGTCEVLEWNPDGSPREYDGECDIDWDTLEPVGLHELPFQCGNCLRRMPRGSLIPKRVRKL